MSHIFLQFGRWIVFSMVEYLASRKCIKKIYHNTKNVRNFQKIFPFDYCLLFCQQSWFIGTNMPIWRLNLTHFYQGTTSRFHILHVFKGRRVSAAFCSDDVQSCAQVFGYCPVVCAPMQRGVKQETRMPWNKMPWNMIQMMYTSTVSRIRFQKCMSDSEGCTGLLGWWCSFWPYFGLVHMVQWFIWPLEHHPNIRKS